MNQIAFDYPVGLMIGAPVALVVLALTGWSLYRRGVRRARLLLHLALRGVALLLLVLLAGRPVWVGAEESEEARKQRGSVVLLVDRSSSMSLHDGASTRTAQARQLLRECLLPALRNEGLNPRCYAFAEDAEEVKASDLASLQPDGRRTNLAGAMLRSVEAMPEPPLAVIAVTDGAANDHTDNARAITALLESQVPCVSIGVGSETAVRTLSLAAAMAPTVAPPDREFPVAARLEMASAGELPPFDLLLLRDGKRVQKKTVTPGKGQRSWLESFRVKESEEGIRTYTVQLDPPSAEGLRCIQKSAMASVRITTEGDFRVLFVQAQLGWDYKFIRLALEADPSISITGLTRMSNQSWFHQDVKSEGELPAGLPSTVEGLAPFRVVVLSGFAASELSHEQQEVLRRFCAEFGGGLLLMSRGGAFDPSWSGAPLAEALPVRLDAPAAGPQVGSPFRLRPTRQALEHPVFRISDRGSPNQAWGRLPQFSRRARVGRKKKGAQVWAVHQQEAGPTVRAQTLMAYQHYGAGASAVICVEELWRWRMAPDSDPGHFDRFWRQLLRHLGEGSGRQVTIDFPDQDLRPDAEVRVVVGRPPDPADSSPLRGCRVGIEDPTGKRVKTQRVDLAPDASVELTFRPPVAGLYTVNVRDANNAPLAARSIEIREANIEFMHASRDMDNLAQWASLTGGVAVKAEDCDDPADILRQLREAPRRVAKVRPRRPPAGVNGWVLLVLLACLGTEWILRKERELP